MLELKMVAYLKLNSAFSREEILEIREAIINYQYGEKIKSCLIIATKLLDILAGLSHEKLLGAQEMVKVYLEALLMEIRIATNTTKAETLREAESQVQVAIGDLQIGDYTKAVRSLSQAISKSTTCCQRAMSKLKDDGLI